MKEGVGIHDLITATLKEMGVNVAPTYSLLMQKGYFVGFKYHFDGGCAVWLIEKKVIEVYDGDGKLLKTANLEETDKKNAA